LILAVLFLVLVLFFLVELVAGSCRSVCDSEVGHSNTDSINCVRLSKSEFFGRLVPIVLTAVGLPLVFSHVEAGFTCLLTAFVLYFIVFK
jgi:hypothetical protein